MSQELRWAGYKEKVINREDGTNLNFEIYQTNTFFCLKLKIFKNEYLFKLFRSYLNTYRYKAELDL